MHGLKRKDFTNEWIETNLFFFQAEDGIRDGRVTGVQVCSSDLPEIRISGQTPPMYIVQANDDPVNSDNSVFLYLGLKRAHVPAELHIYAKGGHGFGLRPSNKPCSTWPQRCAEWMRGQGILKTVGGTKEALGQSR